MEARTTIAPSTLQLTSRGPAPVAQRISFAVRGLQPKDERLFKSFVRLVAHRTTHAWIPTDGAAEVCVSPSAALQEGARHLLLVVAEGEGGPAHHVVMPFHAEDLERSLDALGAVVVATRHAPGPRAQLPRRIQLLRWPTADLLKAPQRMRLATAMSGRKMSVQELHARTSVPYEACAAFAHELMARGFLAEATPDEHDEVTGPALLTPSPQSGLLARIRDRLSRISTTRT